MDFRKKRLTIDTDDMTTIVPQVNIKNMGYESLITVKYQLLAVFEANGANVNHEAKAQYFSTALKSKASVAFPNIEYRITDATEVDSKGRFWALNYFWPGEKSV